MINKKHTTKILYKILTLRGFDDPSIVLKWQTFHPKAQDFFPTSLKPLYGDYESPYRILYLQPQNKMAAVTFTYIKHELLYSLNLLHGFTYIKDITLSKS